MKTFEGLGLSPVLAKSLAHMNYTTPTPIQAQAIPVALTGRDIMGSAQTGTGKTAAFAIPAVEHLLKNERSNALVLTPTRELGKQVMDIMHQLLGPKSPIKTAFLIGGEPMGKQCAQLKRRPRLIVATPGRMIDHLERRNIELMDTDFLILDETDRMLDMGFTVQLDQIFKYMPKERQTLMFSATLPDDIMRMSKNYLTNPERVSVGSTITPAKNIKQDVIRVEVDNKYKVLSLELEERSGSIVIFAKTKRGTEKLAKRLTADGFSADAIHGDLKQSRRDRVIRDYRAKKFTILVATDVVARGLDIPHIEHVINYDLPQVPEDYIHRIGRTARAGAMGSALCLITPQDGRKWHAIECLMNPDAKTDHSAVTPRKKSKHRGRGKPSGKHGQRSEHGQGRPAFKGKSKFAGKPGAKKAHGGGRDDAPRSDKPRSNDRPRSEHTRSDQPRSERPRSDKPRQERANDGSVSPRKSAGGKPSHHGPKSGAPKSGPSKGGFNKGGPKRSGGPNKSGGFKAGGSNGGPKRSGGGNATRKRAA